MLLVMGLDFQMVWWPEEFCARLVDAGFAVVRFDNRDTGLSTHFDPVERPNPWKARLGRVPPAYTARDMLDDALAVMDAVGWSSANILGGSMGGLLAQATGLLHPDRVRSVVSAMSGPLTTSPLKTARYMRAGMVLQMARATRNAGGDDAEALLAAYRLVAGPGEGFDEEWARETARRCVERAPLDPSATQRQMSAGRGITLPPLSGLRPPLLAISGERDPLIKPSGGRATARAVPGARFVSYPAMAHAFPRPLWPQIITEVADLARLGGRATHG